MIYNQGKDITPHDSTDIVHPVQRRLTDAVYVGGAGVVVAVWENGDTTSFTAVAGEILPIAVKRVNATNTTATLLRACYSI